MVSILIETQQKIVGVFSSSIHRNKKRKVGGRVGEIHIEVIYLAKKSDATIALLSSRALVALAALDGSLCSCGLSLTPNVSRAERINRGKRRDDSICFLVRKNWLMP